ncbi:MAG: conjugal transfer protein TraD [Alphaproteobacteria bacterium]|nr:conjugal transfer protein TraD [Alphaproteobacteria bacterium]MBP9777472.1 conjugal transfer protein TraD [Alphaproteobacteria bacterium]
MEAEQQSHRKSRTRQLITLGGLLQKSGMVDAFLIESEDDLQSYENRDKAAKLLGFLYTCFEENTFDEENAERWRTVGERLLKS